ncbi:MAG: type II secretion system F family protein [Pseudomonadota bacterium]
MNAILNLLNSGILMEVLILGAAFLAGFLLVLPILPDEKAIAARRRLGVQEDQARHSKNLLIRLSRFPVQMILPYVSPRISEERRKALHRKLISANLREELSPDEFVGLKFILALVIPILVIFLTGASGRPLPVILWPVVVVGGYYFADGWLAQMIAARRKSIVRALPYTLDLLTLSVEAGLDFIAAIQRLTQKARPNALLTEFSHMLREIRLGTSRSDALRSLSDRLQIEEISSFTTLLIQADQLGASIGNVLRAQSDQMRARRFQAAETAGARASQLILFPLVIFIFPAIFIIILGPAILSFLKTGLY